MIVDGSCEIINVEMINLRVGSLQFLCSEIIYAQESKNEAMKVAALHGEKILDIELVKCFQDKKKKWF